MWIRTIYLLNAETNGTNYRWQIIDGNGTFSGWQTSTLLNPVYTPSQLDLDRGSVTLQLTVDPSGDCAGSDPISDEIEISLTTPLQFQLSITAFAKELKCKMLMGRLK